MIRGTRRRWIGAALAAVVITGGAGPAAASALRSDHRPADGGAVGLETLGVDPATQTRCDPIGGECLLPLPNDHFTVADSASVTGRRLAISSDSMPANVAGVHVDVTDQNRADGWSPGSTMLAEIKGLDVRRSRIPTIVEPSE